MITTLRIYLLALAGIAVLYFLPSSAYAQFGQNKVQYKTFDWSYLQTKHFDIYFNTGGNDIAQFTAFVAESSLTDLTNNIGYQIQNRIPIIVFNSHNDFQQNNILDEYLPEGVGGVTELFKNRITIPFEGDYGMFRHVIHHELLHAFMNDMYYGGSLQNIISKNIQLQFPPWFSEGMAEYQSLSGNDKENDMFLRDAVIYNYLPPIEYINGYLSYRGGQSFFAWLADEYGKAKIGDLMMQIKAFGDVEEGFKDVYGKNLEKLSEKWHKSLKQTYWPDISSRQEVTDFASRITDHLKGDGYYNTAPAVSPKGDKVAYISNRDDYFDVFIADVKSGKIIKKLINGTKTANFEELHLLVPGMCWSPDGRKIAIAVKAGDKDAMYIIDVESEDEQELPLKFDGIFSVDWNPDNNSLAFVGDNSKQSDIWVYDLNSKKLTRITNDRFSDSYPRWSRDGNKIYFTSDRGNNIDLNSIPENIDMAKYDYSEKNLYDYDMTAGTLKLLNSDKGADESHAVSSPDGKRILFISDKNGINNLWMKNLETGEERPITNSLDPIYNLSLSNDGKIAVISALDHGGYDIFYIQDPFEIQLDSNNITNTVFIDKRLKENQQRTSADTLKVTKVDSLKSDSTANESGLTDIKIQGDSINTHKDVNALYGRDITIELKPKTNDSDIAANNNKVKLKESSKFKLKDNVNEDGTFKVNKYKIKFSPDIIYSNVNYSSFYGVQGVAQMAFSDMLGNHRIYILTSLVLDLKNSDYAFAYYYLPKRIDYGIEGYHSARFLLVGNSSFNQLYRYRTYGANLNLSYPIDKFNRIDGAISYNTLTKENLDDPNEPSQSLHYVLPIVSYVHDNTLWGYTAPERGTRYNLTLLGTPKIGADGVSFISGILDYRTYFKFFDDYDFVWRLNTGASFGKNPERFYIGGTDNWINYQIHNDTLPITDIKDFAFATPILPLRGFDYNARSGSKFALMNAELRFPLFKYLVFGPLPLAFQNIQGALFTDIGTVWSDNKKLQFFQSINDKIATKDLLIGMGIGVRIFLLYFPLKFDVAWSYDMQKFSTPKYYISLGADF